jgi:hypothetical protein
MQNLSFGNPPANEYADSITRSLTNAAFSSEIVMVCECGLTKKAEPPPTRDVDRDSGTDRANGGWLRRLVRPKGHKPVMGAFLAIILIQTKEINEPGIKISKTGTTIIVAVSLIHTERHLLKSSKHMMRV